jgi:HK97 family phage major capsid protein
VTRPQGLLQPTKVPAATWSWGRLAYHVTGAAGSFPATNPADVLIDLIYGVRSGYRQNAKFLMNRRTQAVLRKFKTTTGEYLWQPPSGAGENATILNFPVVDAEDMPNIGTDTFPIAFGDFARGYLIVDRVGVRILRDPYSAKPYILYYTTKRVGGGVQDFDAIKLLKMGTT